MSSLATCRSLCNTFLLFLESASPGNKCLFRRYAGATKCEQLHALIRSVERKSTAWQENNWDINKMSGSYTHFRVDTSFHSHVEAFWAVDIPLNQKPVLYVFAGSLFLVDIFTGWLACPEKCLSGDLGIRYPRGECWLQDSNCSGTYDLIACKTIDSISLSLRTMALSRPFILPRWRNRVLVFAMHEQMAGHWWSLFHSKARVT